MAYQRKLNSVRTEISRSQVDLFQQKGFQPHKVYQAAVSQLQEQTCLNGEFSDRVELSEDTIGAYKKSYLFTRERYKKKTERSSREESHSARAEY